MAAFERIGLLPAAAHDTFIPEIHEYLIEEDEMGDSTSQTRLLGYLEAVLQALLGVDGPFVARNLTMFHPAIQNSQNLISPDIALFLDIPLTPEERLQLKSWDMRPSRPRSVRCSAGATPPAESDPPEPRAAVGRPCPPVMIEVSSPSTWKTDIELGMADKVLLYGQMGVQLYLAYDPNDPQVWRRVKGRRLLGWRYDAQGVPQLLEPDERGWLWCAELDSWVGDDGYLLRLYDRAGQRRLTGAEQATVALRQAEVAQRRAEATARAEQAAREQAEAIQKETAERAERFLRLLQEHGIEPDSL